MRYKKVLRKFSKDLLVALMIFSFVFSGVGGLLMEDASADEVDDEVIVCHATGSQENPYEKIEVDKAGAINGHYSHENDIIEPFSIPSETPFSAPGFSWFIDLYGEWFPGKNWDDEGQAIWDNRCEIPEPKNGNLKVRKEVVGDGADESLGFDFVVEGNDNDFEETFSLIHEEEKGFWGIEEGTYTITEDTSNLHDGWSLESVGCVKEGDDVQLSTVLGPENPKEVEIGEDETWVCTFVNRYTEPEAEEVLTIIAHKIVCEDDHYLPKWGAGAADITEETASEFLEAVNKEGEVCWLEDGWYFDWGLSNVSYTDPGDDYIGSASSEYSGWTTFGPTIEGVVTTTITEGEFEDINGNIGMREVLEEGYIPFTHSSTKNPPSAEFYCHNDVANYDNFEWIKNPSLGNTYYCVGFNAPKKADVEVCKENEKGEKLPGWEITLDYKKTDLEFTETTKDTEDDDYGCITFENVPYGEYELSETLQEGWENVSGLGDNTVDGDTEFFTIVNREKKEVTINAYKVICEDESDLPNWAKNENYPVEITKDLIDDYVANEENCWFAEGWDFEWNEPNTDLIPGNHYGWSYDYDSDNAWNSFDTSTDGSGKATVTIPYHEERSHFWIREVLKQGYLPFSDSDDGTYSVSAELICHIDGWKYDNYDRVDNPEDGGEYHCVAFNVPVTTIEAFKVVCEDESDLPDWVKSRDYPTASDYLTEGEIRQYVEDSKGKCWLEEDWEFEWGYDGEVSLEDGIHIGPATGEDWKEFDTQTGSDSPARALIYQLEKLKIWVREVLKTGYLFFTDHPGNKGESVSAELICHRDGFNYDNYEYIDGMEKGGLYTCVAFNVQEEKEPVCDPTFNLIYNGSFEEPEVEDNNGNWELYETIPGWTLVAGDYIELQKGAFNSADDDQHLELDSDGDNPASAVEQKFETIPGESYQLKFAWSPRPEEEAVDSEVNVEVRSEDDSLLLSDTIISGSGDIDWQYETYYFTAQESESIIKFFHGGSVNSYGGLIDDVQVYCGISPDPDPAYIRIKKETNDSETNQKFSFTVSGGNNFLWETELEHGEGKSSVALNSGTYSVFEDDESLPEGWELESVDCELVREDEILLSDINPENIILNEGDTVRCTFTNTYTDYEPEPKGEITVRKEFHSLPKMKTFPLEDYCFMVNEDGPYCFDQGSSSRTVEVPFGPYVVTEYETGEEWEVSYRGDCDGEIVSTTSTDRSLECTIINTWIDEEEPCDPGIILPEGGDDICKGDTLNLEAKDIEASDGGVNWAVRFETCAMGTGTVAGNVDGYTDSSDWTDGIFTADLDTSEWEEGEYCFVFNPNNGERYTRLFNIDDCSDPIVDPYTVTFKDGEDPLGTRNAGDGESLGENMPENPTKTGYTFEGWNTEQDGTGESFNSTKEITGDITVYAMWASEVTTTTPPTPGGSRSGQRIAFISTPAAEGEILGETDDGEVLGETDETSCEMYLYEHLRYGRKNNPDEVLKLQTFLNEHMGEGLPLNGFFGELTKRAVERFQSKYAEQVLAPWGINKPTGYVYLTTRRWINMIVCPPLNLPIPNLVPDSSGGVRVGLVGEDGVVLGEEDAREDGDVPAVDDEMEDIDDEDLLEAEVDADGEETEDEDKGNTGAIVVIILGLAVLGVVLYYIFKPIR